MSSPGEPVEGVAVSAPEEGSGAPNEGEDCARVAGGLSPTAGIGGVCGEGVGGTVTSVEPTDVASKKASSDESPGRSAAAGVAGVMAIASVRAGEEGEGVGGEDGASGASGLAASAGGGLADGA